MKEYFNSPDSSQCVVVPERRTIVQKFEPWAHHTIVDCMKAQKQIDVIKQHLMDHEITEALASLIPMKIWLDEVNAFIMSTHCCFDDDHPMELQGVNNER